MKKQAILDLIVKSEKEIMELSLNSPLIMKGRTFLRRIPSYRMDFIMKKSSNEMLSHLTSFFHSLLKREDISLLEKERIWSFVNIGEAEKLKRGNQELMKQLNIQNKKIEYQDKKVKYQDRKIEKQELTIIGLRKILHSRTFILEERISFQEESIKINKQALRNCRFIILFLSIVSCIESTTQITISAVRKNTIQSKMIGKAIVSGIISCWTSCSILRKRF